MVNQKSSKPKILLTGATGYVGGRLAEMLLNEGYTVRAFGRSMARLKGRLWSSHKNAELACGDALDLTSLKTAVEGCQVIFYLVHSMTPGENNFEKTDQLAAKNLTEAASQSHAERIIYLGGLGDFDHPLISKHLKSRNEVAQLLKSGTVPVTYLKAAMILGAGSASFEIMRYLVDRLPVMVTPRWVQTRSQPIAIRNVLGYLRGCIENDEVLDQTFDIGGPDILNYRELFDIYAREAGLKRIIIPVPVLTPKLSAYWIHLVTPVPSAIAMPLSHGLKNEVICHDNRIRKIIPQRLLSCQEAIHLAMGWIPTIKAESDSADSFWLRPPEWPGYGDAPYSGGTVFESGYKATIEATADEIWKILSQIGGTNGYSFGNYLWHLRGILDRIAGGAGLRQGRRSPDQLLVGDTVDFWRVLEVKNNNYLTLMAEMKLPGKALLTFRLKPSDKYFTEISMISQFSPKGLAGIIYWYAFLPFHEIVFGSMFRSIIQSIEKPIILPPKRFNSKNEKGRHH